VAALTIARNSPQARHFFALGRQFDPNIVSEGDSQDVTITYQARRLPGARSIVAVVLLAVAFLLSFRPALAVEAREAIVVEGNRRVDANTVRSYFHPTPDGRYDEAARDAALKALIETGLFDHVAIDRVGDRLIVHLTEAKVLGRVAFEGNRKIKDADLAAVVQSKPRGSLQRTTVQSDVGRIVEAYRHIGRDDVSVVPEIIDPGGDRVDLVYTIAEGKKTSVRQISFVGNHAFGDRQLKAVIKTSTTSALSFLTGGDVYDPDRVDDDREQIRTYYRNHGYADAIVSEARAEYDPAVKGFTLTFRIDEGEPYHFGDVDIASHVPGLNPGNLHRLLLVCNGAIFDGGALDKTSEALAVEMTKLGYPFAHAEPRMTRDTGARRISVVFVIEEGHRAYVERIDIHGNTRTRDYVIRREFDFGEGDAYNKTLIDRAERRLKNLNYFKSVKISTRPGSAPDRVVLDVEVVDQQTGEIYLSGGYSTTDGLMAELKVGDRNFYGTGDNVQATLSYGQYGRGADIVATDPDLFGNHVSGGIELFDRQTFPSPYQSYGSNSYGVNFTVGTPITEQTNILWRYSLYDQDVTLASGAAGATVSLPIQQAAAAGRQIVSAAGDTVTYSTLDNNKSPTSGINSQLRQDVAGLGGDVRFLRTTEDARYYQTLGSDLVAMVRAQGGYVTGWGGQQVPLMNSFFGGPSMVRGFAPNGFGPRDLTPGSTMDNVGGSMYWATTAELQSAIPGIPQEYGLKGSVFVDAGSVFRYTGPMTFGSQSVQIANNNIMRSSVGVGLTWASPFGALTVNYAVPIAKASYDLVQPLNFSAGPF
jgi:outer membrane protein insertion porin family